MEDLVEDFRNTLNYFYEPKPIISVSTPSPIEEEFLKETLKELTIIMSNEWLREVKLSPEVFRVRSPSSTIQCHITGVRIDTLYNPTISANLMSASLR